MYELFSYWILLWALLFCLGLVKNNPIFILFPVFIITSISYIYIYINNDKNENRSYYLLKFIIINLLLKFIFIIIIASNYSLKFDINDIYFGLVLFFLYLILMASLNKNFIYYYYYLIDIFINGENEVNSKYLLPVDIYYDRIVSIVRT